VKTAGAGHCALLHRKGEEREFDKHPSEGPPLGISPAADFDEREFDVQRGDAVFALTDGCYEFDRRMGAAAGLRALEDEFHTARSSPPAELVPAVLQRILARAGELPDDCTLVAMSFKR
jgi:serine phosphatase RsbU (regulator of sigma subunit)